jgi:hypothetical protein
VASTPAATPAPIPALAPLLRPLELEVVLAGWVEVGVGVGLVGVVLGAAEVDGGEEVAVDVCAKSTRLIFP